MRAEELEKVRRATAAYVKAQRFFEVEAMRVDRPDTRGFSMWGVFARRKSSFRATTSDGRRLKRAVVHVRTREGLVALRTK